MNPQMPELPKSSSTSGNRPLVALMFRRATEEDLLQETAEHLSDVWLAPYWVKLSARQVRWQQIASELQQNGVRIVVAFGGAVDSDAAKIAAKTMLPVLALPPVGRGRPLSRIAAGMHTSKEGAPVGMLALGTAGARNAALFSAAILALNDRLIAAALRDYREQQTSQVLASRLA